MTDHPEGSLVVDLVAADEATLKRIEGPLLELIGAAHPKHPVGGYRFGDKADRIRLIARFAEFPAAHRTALAIAERFAPELGDQLRTVATRPEPHGYVSNYIGVLDGLWGLENA